MNYFNKLVAMPRPLTPCLLFKINVLGFLLFFTGKYKNMSMPGVVKARLTPGRGALQSRLK